MNDSARPKLTVEEAPQQPQGIMQPQPKKDIKPPEPVYVKPEVASQSFVPNPSPVANAGDPVSAGISTNANPPQLPRQTENTASQTNIVKVSSRNWLSLSMLKFIIPAVILLAVIVLGAIFIPKLLTSTAEDPAPVPEPTLIPATPIPTPEALPRTRTYYSVDKKITFDYLSSFILVECEQKVLFANSKPENPEEFCNTQEGAVLGIGIADTSFGDIQDSDTQVQIANESSGDAIYYLISLLDTKYTQLFDTVVNSVKFIDPNLTDNWENYTSELGYSISYPPEWTLIPAEDREGSTVTEIRKDVTDSNLHNLAIKVTEDVSNANLSASEIISSLQDLSGWKQRPNVEFRIIDGEIAQVVQGEHESYWKVNVIVWRGTSLVEMTWQDEVPQPERVNFEGLLSTFRFD